MERRRHRGLGALAVSAVLALSGCASQMVCQRSSDPMESEQCTQTGTPIEAAGSAAAAGAAWATVGCRQAGCNLPYTCNHHTGLCERMHCSEGHACPAGFSCNLVKHVCE